MPASPGARIVSALAATDRDNSAVRLTVLSSSVLFGIGLFLVNSVGESLVGLPLAEFALVGLLLLSPKAHGRPDSSTGWTTLWLLIALTAGLAASSDILNGAGMLDVLRDASRLALLFVPALLYARLARPEWFLGVALGLVLADSLSAVVATVGAITAGSSPQLLKIVLPLPGIVLLGIVSTGRLTSVPLRLALVVSLAVVSAGAVISGSRNALVSIALVGGALAVGRSVPRASRGAVLVGGLMAWIPIALVWNLPVVGFLFESGIATASNVERTVALLVSRDLIESSPLTGTGLAVFPSALDDALEALARQGFALDPHNFYMQVGVAFGIPAMVLITILTLAMFRWGFRLSSLPPWQRGACLLLLGWMVAITPLSGTGRIVWTALWIILLGIHSRREPDEGLPDRVTPADEPSLRVESYPVPIGARSPS